MTQRDFSSLFCGGFSPKIFPVSTFFFGFNRKWIFLWGFQFLSCTKCLDWLAIAVLTSRVWKIPVRTQPKLILQGQPQYHFTQRCFVTYLRQKKITALQFQLLLDSVLKLFYTIIKTSQSVVLWFNTEETVQHSCDAVYVNF